MIIIQVKIHDVYSKADDVKIVQNSKFLISASVRVPDWSQSSFLKLSITAEISSWLIFPISFNLYTTNSAALGKNC